MQGTTPGEPLEDIAEFLNLCKYDPDAGLGLIKKSIGKNPELDSHLLMKFGKVIAYESKVFQFLRTTDLTEHVDKLSMEDLRKEVPTLLTNEHVRYLELALSEIRQIEDVDPKFITDIGTDEDPRGEIKVQVICNILEGCKPGRVQEILGKTKLSYFGTDRTMLMPNISNIPPQDLRPFTGVYFSLDSIVRSALLVDFGTDNRGRKYIMCMLYKRLFDDLGPDETFEDAVQLGTVYLFDDNTFAYDVEKVDHIESRQDKKKGFFKRLFP